MAVSRLNQFDLIQYQKWDAVLVWETIYIYIFIYFLAFIKNALIAHDPFKKVSKITKL